MVAAIRARDCGGQHATSSSTEAEEGEMRASKQDVDEAACGLFQDKATGLDAGGLGLRGAGQAEREAGCLV